MCGGIHCHKVTKERNKSQNNIKSRCHAAPNHRQLLWLSTGFRKAADNSLKMCLLFIHLRPSHYTI
jgi:hypothetical protein